MNIYERIRALCQEKGISVRKLEEQLGFSYGSIAKWPDHTPSYEKLKKVADFFNVSVEYLTTGETGYYENEDTAAIAQEIFDNHDLRVLFDAARDADPEDLQTTYDMLMALKRKEKGDDYA